MSNRHEATSGGVGCLTLLGLLFIGLKLYGVGQVVTWSWWWVLAPFWIGPLFLGIVGGFVASFAAIFMIFQSLGRRRRSRKWAKDRASRCSTSHLN